MRRGHKRAPRRPGGAGRRPYLRGLQRVRGRGPMTDITLTFPDGSKRPLQSRASAGVELAAAISKSLAKKAVAMVVDGQLADLADPIAADASVKIVTRTDPEALELIRHDCRARDGRGRAGAVARHPGHHRPRDRERLLLRLRQGGALPPRRPRAHRGQDARDRRPQRALHQGALEPRATPRPSSRRRASCSRSSWSTRSPRARTSRSTSRASGSISAAART